MTTNIQRCVDMHKAGFSIAEMASELGLKYGTISSYIHTARVQGRIPLVERRVPKASCPVGRLGSAVLRLPDDVYDWLVNQTPASSTLSDTLLAIATDVYHEEVGR